ncbi:MAG: DNA-processing protein DprA [Lachnospiraceae bacterium]|nr:DNA-processing protein DprA [Lachnospiraceae bacterium]
MDQKVLAYWLANQPGFGRKKIQILWNCFGSLEDIFYSKEHTLQQVPGITDRERKILQQDRNYALWQEKLCRLQKRNIRFIWRQDREYPDRLASISDPPFGLYVRGKLPEEDKPTVAIVGAREASHEGKEIARKFGRELAENGIRIISGLARGIDVTAQRGALEIPAGRTYGVLGTGIDICYPRNHIETYMQVIRQGGLISEYGPGTPGKAGMFAVRNQIISGLADGILVVEARENSGSLITAETGLDQGKEIFAIPGSILNPSYRGSNRLLQEGACFVTQVRDILDGLGIFYDEDISIKKKKIEVMLETPEKIVYAILGFDPIHISDLAERTGLPVTEVMDSLGNLERKRLIRMVGNHYYALCL